MRTLLLIALGVITGTAIAAKSDWQAVGETANGNKVYLDVVCKK